MPPIEHLVEAGIYADDLEQAETFYRDVRIGADATANDWLSRLLGWRWGSA